MSGALNLVSQRGTIRLAMGKVPEGLTLVEAAERLGCHVETLRLRVRDRELKVRRGPHGRYYVREEDLAEMPALRRPVVRREYSAEELAAGWGLLENYVVSLGADRPTVQRVLNEITDQPGRLRHYYRLLAVKRLRLVGLTFDQVATELGISERQVRRLAETFRDVMGRFYRPVAARILQAREAEAQARSNDA